VEQLKTDGRTRDPGQEAARRDEVVVLQQAVARLPEDYRTVVVLRYLEDMSCQDVAEALDLPLGTVKTWLFRAREMLKERLKPEE
jgi:RNA polymerase sigma-70 factor (ECF subfamily)